MDDPNNPGAAVPPVETTPPGPLGPTPPGGDGGAQFLELGGEKLPLEQATELVQLGKTFKPLREKYKDVDFEGMVPAFTQQSQLLRDPEKLAAYLEQKFPGRFQPAQPAAPSQDEQQLAQVAEVLAQLGFVRKDGLDSYYQQRKQADQYEGTVSELANELSGKDGRPKFDRDAIEAFMIERKIFDPRAAYETMHREALTEWVIAKKLGNKPRGTSTGGSGAGPQLPKGAGTPKFGTPEMAAAMAAEMGGGDTTE